MLKKQSAVIAMCLAYVIMLAHSIVPHHHHDQKDLYHMPGEMYHLDHHDHDFHHSDDMEPDNDLGHLLSHLVPHGEDVFAFIALGNLQSSGFKQAFELFAVVPAGFFISLFEVPPLNHFQPPEKLLYISPEPIFISLRGPPFLAV